MKTTLKTVILGVSVAGSLLASSARAELVDKVAAVVNNDIVPFSEVEQRAAPELARLSQEPNPAARAKARAELTKAALDQLIGEKLIDAELKEANIELTDAQLQTAIDEKRKEVNLSPEQFEQAIREQGYSMSTFKEQFRHQMQRQQLIRVKVLPKIKVTEQDLKGEYQKYLKSTGDDFEVHVRHVVVAVPAGANAEQMKSAEAKARTLAKEAQKPGVDFADFAKKHSDGSSAADGGDLGFFKRGTMEATFDKVAFALQPGQVSEPVRTKFGFHILKLEERRNSAAKTYANMKPELQQRLQQAQAEKATQQYVDGLRQNATVDVKI